ncbi:hypothetical protein GCM10010278_57270 [Streptomyces melanogenes]|nr:hypothetical protein GCM10010278_57270 [Streptomyces melanogenes]
MPTDSHPRQPSSPQGWRMEPIPSRPPHRDDDGSIRVPVWLSRDGRHVADTEMVLLPYEAELLADRLTAALGSGARSVLHELMQTPAAALGPGVALVWKDDPSQI